MNISNFMTWFIQQFVNIATNLVDKLDLIKLNGTVSLLDFSITLAIISAFLGLVITAPKTALNVSRKETKERSKNDK